jgi:benzoate membrane transport protein
MSLSPILTAITAAIVGCGGSIAIVFAACEAVGATPAQTTSWIAAVCLAIAATAAVLSVRHRLPIITAWSTPGAALIAASASPALTMETAVGAFIVAALLIVAASLVEPLARLIERLPLPIASAMLAGVVARIVMAPIEEIPREPALILPLIGAFLLLRRALPSLAVIAVLVGGAALAQALGLMKPLPEIAFASPEWIVPRFDPAVALGLGVPLFLVTMASQNLAGFAVLRASGYGEVPTRSILAVTGLASLLSAPFGAHTSNIAAISAAICTGPDTHPDPAKRWLAGPPYALCYVVFAALAPSLVALFAALPAALVKTVAGVALASALMGALSAAFSGSHDKFAPVLTFVVTLSGITLLGIGAAFWGLLAGLLAVAAERLTGKA